MSYTTAAKVRQLDKMLDSTDADGTYEFLEAVILSVCDNHVQARIDSMLGQLYTVPFTVDDDSGTISSIAAKMTASLLISGGVAQFSAANPEKAASMWEEALDWLTAIKKGEEYLSFTKIQKTIDVIYDEDPNTRPLNEIFSSADPSNWKTQTETRGST